MSDGETRAGPAGGTGDDRIRVLYAGDGAESGVGAGLDAAEGLTVSAEPTESAALDHLRRERVDCLVATRSLSEGDALDLLREAGDVRPDLPVVFSAEADARALSEAVAAGIDRYCPTGAAGREEDPAALVRDAVADAADRQRYEAELDRRERVLRRLHRVTADTDRSFEEQLEELLAIGREELDAEYGSLSRLEGEDYVFEHVQQSEGNETLSEGDVVPLSWTSCERAVTTEETLVVSDMSSAPDLARREGNVELGLTCYLGTPVVVDGEVTGTFCFYDDERRAASFSEWEVTLVELMGTWVSYEREHQHREAALVRERDRLEEFANLVSHDLRNPLQVAQGRLELARERCDDESLAEVAEALDRMDDLVADVLSLARLGEDVVDTELLRLEPLVQEAWATADVDGTLVVDGPVAVEGDETRLKRLFENLFHNAAEHGSPSSGAHNRDTTGAGSSGSSADGSPEDGGDDAGAGVTVRVGPLDGESGFYVADDGPGIPEAERDEVFESGYSTRDDGTGFGLSIVEEVVAAHGGTVAVTDAESGGARFEVRGIETDA